MTHLWRLLCGAGCIVLLACSESKKPLEISADGDDIRFAVSLSKVAATSIDRAEVVVTGSDMSDISQALVVDGGTISGTVSGITPGSRRTFKMNAYDATGVLIYSGSTTVDVIVGEPTQVAITLFRIAAPVLPSEVLHQLPDGTTIPMMLVPEGVFTMGTDAGEVPEGPPHEVFLDAYQIGRFEVTNIQYEVFLNSVEMDAATAWAYTNPRFTSPVFIVTDNADRFQFPVRASKEGAQAFCEWASSRLPTEAEWEKAARGTDERSFPWGEGIDPSKANYQDFTSPSTDFVAVGSYPDGISPYGVHDMAGNGGEWVSDKFDSAYYLYSPRENPTGPTADFPGGVVRGGSDGQEALLLRTTSRYGTAAAEKWGFRCVRGLE